MTGRWAASGLLAAGAATLLALGIAPSAAASEPDPRPNVIVVVTDDQSLATFRPEYMPRTFKHFVEPGTNFSQAVVASPLCCPSRAALSTGQYGHNNGVLRNQYSLLEGKRNVLPGWLRRSGYRTMHVGRFYNGWGFAGRKSQVAPGWDIWRTALEPHSYYDYRMRFNRRFRNYGTADGEYLTTNLNRIAASLVRKKASARKPFYLQFDHFAPHDGPGARGERCSAATPVPAPVDGTAFADAPLPDSPAFNEADLSDKPGFLQATPPVTPELRDLIEENWRCTLATLQEVDRGMGMLWRELRLAGALKDTAVIFTSDNGYLYGQHRVVLDKHYPYEESVRVPLAIRLPASVPRQPAGSAAPVANIDLAPTILELAQAEPCKAAGCRTLDGRSLLGEAGTPGAPLVPAGRGIGIEYDGDEPHKGLVCEYQAIRTPDRLYVQHIRGRSSLQATCASEVSDVEYYRLGSDPFQLVNRHPSPEGTDIAADELSLAIRNASLADCSGIAGRDPQPESGSYCE